MSENTHKASVKLQTLFSPLCGCLLRRRALCPSCVSSGLSLSLSLSLSLDISCYLSPHSALRLPYPVPAEGEEGALETLDERPHVVQREGLSLLVKLGVVQDYEKVAEQATHHGDGGVQPWGIQRTPAAAWQQHFGLTQIEMESRGDDRR